MQTLGIQPRTTESGSTVELDPEIICMLRFEKLVDPEQWF